MTNLSNVNTKSCLRNQRVYVFIFLFFLFHLLDTLFLWYSIKPTIFTLHYTDFQCYNQWNLNETF